MESFHLHRLRVKSEPSEVGFALHGAKVEGNELRKILSHSRVFETGRRGYQIHTDLRIRPEQTTLTLWL